MDLGLEYHGTRLLEWLYERPKSQQSVTYFDVAEFTDVEELPEGYDLTLAEHLHAKGLVAQPGSSLAGWPTACLAIWHQRSSTPVGGGPGRRVPAWRRNYSRRPSAC